MQHKSLFIVIEGLDGSGKSSASQALTALLDPLSKGIVKLTYEPNDASCSGLQIRQILKKQIRDHKPSILPLAYAANRLDHCNTIVKPWLETEGHIVICDRYYLSSLVYQSRLDFPFEKVMIYNEYALKPDVIFFINVDTKVCYERMKIRNQPEELFEANLDESRQKYFAAIEFLRKTHDENIIEIDGGGTIEAVAVQIQKEIFKLAPYLAPSV